MKKQYVIYAFIASMLGTPIFGSCSVEAEDDFYDAQEFSTLASARKTRAAETPQTPTIDFTDKIVEAGCDTITIGHAIPVEVVIGWSEGYIKRSNPSITNNKSLVNTSEAWAKSPNTGNAHVEVANLLWDLFDGHIYGQIQIKGSFDPIGGVGNYKIEFEDPVNFTPKNINIKQNN